MIVLARALVALFVLAFVAQTPAPEAARAHWAVSSSNPEAQAAFDRGLAMMYAFNIGEARLTFAKAGALDPNLAMAWWGVAQAESFDINGPQTGAGDRRATAALNEARARLGTASPAERELIEAIAPRYGPGTKDERFARFADAMTRYAGRHNDDANALTLAAFARWNATETLLGPGKLQTPAAREIVANIDRALVLEPANLGAHHLRIHLWEVLRKPETALENARFLDGLNYEPGMSHLQHMSGHTYTRIGDYDALIAANQAALANDAAYFALGNGAGQNYIRNYHLHDVEFVVYGLTTQGRNAEARAAAAKEGEMMRRFAALRMHDDAEVLTLSRDGPQAFYRAIAYARLGRLTEARTELRALEAGTDSRARINVARAVIARTEGNLTSAIGFFRAAITALAGEGLGDPKTMWPTPPGEGYAAALLANKQYAQAEAAFRNELRRYPNDPRLAFGLAEALRLQRKDDSEARALAARGWRGERPLTLADLG
jgi:tetratricopeptide (TPR) repeat protein